MAASAFISKWNSKHLQDDGGYVSKEYNTFQNAFKHEMSKIAENIGATLVSFSKGHYDVSGFIERNGKYVYFEYDSSLCGDRATPKLKDSDAMYCRTAENAKDYRGGYNNFTSFEDCESVIDRLLNTEHKRAF
jgi:hypothetical protein